MEELAIYQALALARAGIAPRCMRSALTDERDCARWLDAPRFPLPLRIERLGSAAEDPVAGSESAAPQRTIVVRCMDLAAGELFAKVLMTSMLTQTAAERERFFGVPLPGDAAALYPLYLSIDQDLAARDATEAKRGPFQDGLLKWAGLSGQFLGDNDVAVTPQVKPDAVAPNRSRTLIFFIDRLTDWAFHRLDKRHGHQDTMMELVKSSPRTRLACRDVTWIELIPPLAPEPRPECTVLTLDAPRSAAELETYLGAWRHWFPQSRVADLDLDAWRQSVAKALAGCGHAQFDAPAPPPSQPAQADAPSLHLVNIAAALAADREDHRTPHDLYRGVEARASWQQQAAAKRIVEGMLVAEILRGAARTARNDATSALAPMYILNGIAALPQRGIGDYGDLADRVDELYDDGRYPLVAQAQLMANGDTLAQDLTRNPLLASLLTPAIMTMSDDRLAIALSEGERFSAGDPRLQEELIQRAQLLRAHGMPAAATCDALWSCALSQHVAHVIATDAQDGEDPLLIAGDVLPAAQAEPFFTEVLSMLSARGHTLKARLAIEGLCDTLLDRAAKLHQGLNDGDPDAREELHEACETMASAVSASLRLHLGARGRPLEAWLRFATEHPAGDTQVARVFAQTEELGGLAAANVQAVRDTLARRGLTPAF